MDAQAFPAKTRVAKSGILSRDLGIFYISWDVFGILILKIQSRDFLGFFRIRVLNLVIKFLVKLAS